LHVNVSAVLFGRAQGTESWVGAGNFVTGHCRSIGLTCVDALARSAAQCTLHGVVAGGGSREPNPIPSPTWGETASGTGAEIKGFCIGGLAPVWFGSIYNQALAQTWEVVGITSWNAHDMWFHARVLAIVNSGCAESSWRNGVMICGGAF